MATFQFACLLDTSRGDLCRHARREADELGRFMAEMMREPETGAWAA
jgi:hypothetical protein